MIIRIERITKLAGLKSLLTYKCTDYSYACDMMHINNAQPWECGKDTDRHAEDERGFNLPDLVSLQIPIDTLVSVEILRGEKKQSQVQSELGQFVGVYRDKNEGV
jgi:hypothetical protein